jgi:hypothetical protein
MTVPSRFSMKNAVATRMEIVLELEVGDSIIVVGAGKSPGKV